MESNERNEDELIDKIYEIDDISQSQLDRNNIKNLIENELFDFLRVSIYRAKTKSKLKEDVEKIITRRLEEDVEGEISLRTLTSLYETLSREENDVTGGILGVIKEQQKVVINNSVQGGEQSKQIVDVSTEEVQYVKELLETIKELKETEFNKGEKIK